MSFARRAFVLTACAFAAAPSACSSSSASEAPPEPPAIEAGVDASPPPPEPAPAGTPITVTTFAPASSTSPAAKTNATWAAYRNADGSWTKVEPQSPATYVFPARGDGPWSIAFACADNQNALVAVYERPLAVTSLDATLATWCGPPSPPVYTIVGHLTNVPTTSSWLDFAYGLESRGAVIPLAGTDADYEQVNVTGGTWDLMFGLRDESTAPLSKVALVRSHALTADETLDVDLAGAAAVTTTTKALLLHGLTTTEAVAAPVYYTTGGGVRGLELGQSLPPPAVDMTTTYATLPTTAQTTTDRYRLELLVEDGDQASRGAIASFHDAADIEVTAPSPMAPPVVSAAATAPYLRIAAAVATRPTASLYDVETFVRVSNKSRVMWRVSIDATLASGATATLTMPDLSTATGFDPEWALPTDYERTTTATVYDEDVALGDGTLQTWTSRAVTVAAE